MAKKKPRETVRTVPTPASLPASFADTCRELAIVVGNLSMLGLSIDAIGFSDPTELTRVKKQLSVLAGVNGPTAALNGVRLVLSPHARGREVA